MVSFRYHLISLTAVFLALSVGIVVGTTTTGPSPALVVSAPPTSSDAFVKAVGPRLVKGALTGQRVLILLAPDARPGGLVAQLELAGASVTAQLRLRPALTDQGTAATVDDVVTGVLPAGVDLPPGDALDRAGAVLASTLTVSARGTDASREDRQRVYGGFTEAGLFSAEGAAPTARATLVLFVAGPSRGTALSSLAEAFAERVGVVVAGPLTATRGVGALAVLRGQSGGVSDVDGADTAQGLVAVVLALAEQAAGGSGHYGTGPGASDAVPDLS